MKWRALACFILLVCCSCGPVPKRGDRYKVVKEATLWYAPGGADNWVSHNGLSGDPVADLELGDVLTISPNDEGWVKTVVATDFGFETWWRVTKGGHIGWINSSWVDLIEEEETSPSAAQQ